MVQTIDYVVPQTRILLKKVWHRVMDMPSQRRKPADHPEVISSWPVVVSSADSFAQLYRRQQRLQQAIHQDQEYDASCTRSTGTL
jgi:hypothetical protein